VMKWINVKDKLPPEEIIVLTWSVQAGFSVGYLNKKGEWWDKHGWLRLGPKYWAILTVPGGES
jgi:hypothetical protein